MIELLDIGDRVETGSYRLHTRFHAAAAFTRPEWTGLVFVVDETKAAGPANVMVRGADFSRTGALEVAPEFVRLDGVNMPVTLRSRWRVRPAPLDRGKLRRNLRVLRKTLLALAPPRSIVFTLLEKTKPSSALEAEFARRMRAGVHRLLAGDMEAAGAIGGLGFGLTPSGDDFLAGYLLGLYALGPAACARRHSLRRAARSGNPFSAVMLAHAAEGFAIEPACSLNRVLFSGSPAAVARHTARLASVGASSGADLGTGVYFSLQGAAA